MTSPLEIPYLQDVAKTVLFRYWHEEEPMTRYGKAASKSVRRAMRQRKQGTLRSGPQERGQGQGQHHAPSNRIKRARWEKPKARGANSSAASTGIAAQASVGPQTAGAGPRSAYAAATFARQSGACDNLTPRAIAEKCRSAPTKAFSSPRRKSSAENRIVEYPPIRAGFQLKGILKPSAKPNRGTR